MKNEAKNIQAAAYIGVRTVCIYLFVYSRFDDEQKKNDLCKPIDAPHLPSQWFQLQYISNLNGQLIGKALGKVIETK